MKSIDQAFIKAFGQQQPKVAAVPAMPPQERELYVDANDNIDQPSVQSESRTSAESTAVDVEAMFFDTVVTDTLVFVEPANTVDADAVPDVVEGKEIRTDSPAGTEPDSSIDTAMELPSAEQVSADADKEPVEPIVEAVEPPVENAPQVESEPTAIPSKSEIAAIKPAWEVDAFRIPEPCQRMNNKLQGQLHDVRKQLQDAANDRQKLIAIHSWTREEGRTTLAIALAEFLATHGSRVAIVDVNYDRPNLAECVGLTVDFGWEKFATGDELLDECCVRSIGDGFTVFPMVDSDWSIGDLGFGATLRSMLDATLPSYDFVLLDTAPGRPVWDTELEDILAAQLIVRDVRQTTDDEVLRLKRHINQQSSQIVDIVDNFSLADILTLKKTA